jgi:hypothetical protein
MERQTAKDLKAERQGQITRRKASSEWSFCLPYEWIHTNQSGK